MHALALAFAHCHHRGVVRVQDHDTIAAKDARLGLRVFLNTAVTIHVIATDIEHSGRARVETVGRLQLKAGELEHEDLGALTIEQRQGRHADVAAHARVQTSLVQHGAYQRGHRALTVRPGYRKHRCRYRLREQLDIADGACTVSDRPRNNRFAQ